jgi:hypothetical protein
MQPPIVITMDTKPDEYSFRFLKTLTKNGWAFRLIGSDTEWKSFFDRIILYRKEIATLDPNRLCVVSDCRDVLCMRSSERFMEAFITFKSNLIVSAELLCGGYTDPKYRQHELTKYNCEPLYQYWEAKGYALDNLPPRKYVNAGLIAGYAKDILKMYDWMIAKGIEVREKDDQVLMGMYLNAHPAEVTVDTEASLMHTSTFACTGGYLNKEQAKDSPTIAQILGHSSFFLHLPGLSAKKGNYIVYNMVATLIDAGFCHKNLLDAYGVKEEYPYGWYQEDYS